MKKRILSTILTVCMVLGLLPGTAWAAVASGSDTLYDILITDDYFGFPPSGGTPSGEEADVESVLELLSQLDTPTPPEAAFSARAALPAASTSSIPPPGTAPSTTVS